MSATAVIPVPLCGTVNLSNGEIGEAGAHHLRRHLRSTGCARAESDTRHLTAHLLGTAPPAKRVLRSLQRCFRPISCWNWIFVRYPGISPIYNPCYTSLPTPVHSFLAHTVFASAWPAAAAGHSCRGDGNSRARHSHTPVCTGDAAESSGAPGNPPSISTTGAHLRHSPISHDPAQPREFGSCRVSNNS